MTLSRTSSGIYLLDITTWIFPSWTSLISYRVRNADTHPLTHISAAGYVFRRTNPKNEHGRKNVFIIRPENGAEWRNAALKPTGQRSSPFVADSRFGNLWIWENAAAWAPAWRQHSSSVQNIQICMKLREDSAYLERLYECDSDVHVSVYLLLLMFVWLTECEE